ncbi:C4-dicarboxylate TRAP transporter substrate-binding protein [Chelatococcus daeguensis]|uniref:C4-dicarboxylate TRAP transporter substrate-binding protein n=1 Tax=Chelatococcus daeguensis TaxID=444444 RepID=UPI0007AC121D|nr:C4-dicarboxylate TRAP transporter substrate-binding protein [Chelatococcus daeguensis]KZE35834.1 C4-dicarboxylate ABC transporter [Chelatococcus daeguensis]MBM3085144.1 C4-dicarboxylate TRAP transporter substrate-binding protein [Chelatococcus daeguensis]
MFIHRVVLSACAGLAALAAATTMSSAALAAKYQLNINTALTTDDPIYKGLERLRDRMKERSNGEFEIRIFSGSQLGKDEDVLEQARAGANVAVVVDGGRLAVFVPEFGVLGGPFLASGYDGVRKVVTSPLFDAWAQKLRKASGHEVLSFNWWQGERHLLTNKPVSKPADLAGVRMRTPGAPVWIETIRAMGATPTPMAWAEVYPALQQQAIDAVEAQTPAAYGARLYEVTKHMTKTGHINLITGLVTSAGWFDGLPADMQTALKEEALAAGDFASRTTEEAIGTYEKDMAAKGVTITEIDVTPFREATADVYDKLGYAELKKTIDEMLK